MAPFDFIIQPRAEYPISSKIAMGIHATPADPFCVSPVASIQSFVYGLFR
jgi:hypothetical protein